MSFDYSVCVGEMYSSHCYKVSRVTALQNKVVHGLLLPDCEAKIQHSEGVHESVFNGLLDLKLMFYFEKAWFTLSSYVNSQNNRHWSTDNYHNVHEVALHALKAGVLCATGAWRMIVAHDFS
jgi:hypothetical protein